MNGTSDTVERLFALFVLAVVLFTPPLITIFDRPGDIAGVPALYFYLFAAWAGLILFMACATEFSDADDPGSEQVPAGSEPPPSPDR